ncbi:MAG: tetratricopeptide repeat protein [bacterium]
MTFKTKLFVVIVLSGLVTGCGIWRNFNTYFNRYFNTSLAFENAMDELNKQKKVLFNFKEEPVPAAAKQQFEKVVEKASKILQFDFNSAFFDDALLLIGKSFYYLQEYSKAYRKFQELAAINDSELLLENRLWIGKTQLQLRFFEEGLNTLDEVKKQAIEEEEIEIYTEAYIKQIAYYKYKEDYLKTVNLCEDLLKNSDSDELNAEITYEIGKLYVLLNDYEKAINYFGMVVNYAPTAEVEFNSQLEVAKLQKSMGENELSLITLKRLREQNKYNSFWGDIDLEIGLIKYEQGDIEDALDLFTSVDTLYKQTVSAGIAGFMKGQIFEKDYKNYDTAKVFYDKMLSSQAPVDYKDKAKKKSEVLKKLLTLRESVYKYKKQLNYILDPKLYAEDSIKYFLWKNRDSMTIKREHDLDSINKTKPVIVLQPVKSTITADSLQIIMAKVEYDYGSLFLGELSEPDSAYKYYYNIVTNYPQGKHSGKTYFALGTYFSTIGNQEKADSMYRYVYDNYTKDPIVNIAAQKLGFSEVDFTTDPVEKLYKDAEKKYYQKDYPNAINDLKFIFHNNDKSYFASKSLYTIGYIYENDLKMFDSAAVYYDTLNIKYKTSEFARAVTNKLSFFKLDEKRKQAVRDSIQKVLDDSLRIIQLEIQKKIDEQKMMDSLKNASINQNGTINNDSLNTNLDKPKVDSLNINPVPIKNDSLGTKNKSIQNDSLSINPQKPILDEKPNNPVKGDSTNSVIKKENPFLNENKPNNLGIDSTRIKR